MTKKSALVTVAGVAALIVALLITVSAASDSQGTCPDGQHLAAIQVGNDRMTNDGELPPGYTIQDSASGAGLDYTVISDNNSATLHVKGGAGTLTITCR